MSREELRLAKLWYDEDGKAPLEISQLLRRDKSTIARHVVKRARQKRDGRPRALTESEVDALESLLVKMIKKAMRTMMMLSPPLLLVVVSLLPLLPLLLAPQPQSTLLPPPLLLL